MMLELRDIYKTYLQGKLEVPVLGGISLSVEEGEYLAIMGPSGSGKTTLMNIIGCLDNPTSGDYILDGENIAQLSEKRMSDVRLHSIGFVFQSFYLLSKQTALDNVALPLLYAGVRRKERQEIARQALERVGLGDRTTFTPTQLSGGQCQRVAIARAIVNSPKILLADEPTGALDTRSGEQIMEIFQRLNEEGVTVVMITHEPEIAAHAKRVLHIRDGLLVNGSGQARRPVPVPAAAPAPEFTERAEPLPGPVPAPKPASEAAPQSAPESAPAEARHEAPKHAARSKPGLWEQLRGQIGGIAEKAAKAAKAAKSAKPAKAAEEPQEAPAQQTAEEPNPNPPAPPAEPASNDPDAQPISGQTIIAALERQSEQLSGGQEAAPIRGEEPADEQ